MPKVRCPSCGLKGEVRGTEEFFEVRGQHPTSRMPVRKCRNCGAGFEVKPGFLVLFGSANARAIPPDFWRRMEASWRRFEESMETGPPVQGDFTPPPDQGVTPHDPKPLAKLAEVEEEIRRRREEK